MTLASAATRGATRHPLLWVALTLSLVLNLCFVAGALWIRIQSPAVPVSPAERLQRVGTELALDPQQRQAFEQYSEIVRTHMLQMRETVEPLMSAAWAELAKPDADQATAARLFDEAGQARRGLQRELLVPTLTFLATLSPEQRARFVELFHQRPRSWGQPPQHESH
ncbi:MAG: periplasmic heavy metal sensor [Alphaproteobacteria bacterium]|nr:periplasmic heavy metal sensor [Alphaproteobacteria bacterium]